MKKFFNDHISLVVLIMAIVAIIALVLGIMNRKAQKEANAAMLQHHPAAVTISQDEYNALSEEERKAYHANGDGTYSK